MKKVISLLLVLVASVAVATACAKSSQSTSTSASESPQAAASSMAMASASSMAMASAAPAAATTGLPIPLSKLPSEKVAAGDVAAGAKIFAANCESCHGAGGKNGTVGPSLYGVGFTAGQVAYMVNNPTGVDKQSAMPKLGLPAKEVADVAAYVASLK